MTVVVFGDKEFPSKAKATAYVRRIILDIGECSSVKQKKGDTFLHLLDVLLCHPDADTKLSNMVDLAVRVNPMNRKAYGVYVIRDDGTEEDISWVKCITPPTIDSNLKNALRQSIAWQILAFRADHVTEGTLCGLCGSKPSNIHIDHVVPFCQLIKDFHMSWNGPTPLVFVEGPRGMGNVFQEEDKPYQTAWEDYHKKYAVLRVTCASCNLRRSKGGD